MVKLNVSKMMGHMRRVSGTLVVHRLSTCTVTCDHCMLNLFVWNIEGNGFYKLHNLFWNSACIKEIKAM